MSAPRAQTIPVVRLTWCYSPTGGRPGMHEGARLNRHGRSGRRTGMEIVISGGQDMTERGTRKDFALWVEPSLTFMARYAARQVGPGDRDDVVAEALGGAWQRWSTYDESRGTAVAWLLGILAER